MRTVITKRLEMAKLVACACGCGRQFSPVDNHGRLRRFVSGHNPPRITLGLKVSQECVYCAKMFTSYRTNKRKFCSRSCKAKHIGRRLAADPFYAEQQRRRSILRGQKPPLHTGAGHWNWKGGITEAGKLWRTTEVYRQWRISVWSRDRFQCQNCGVVGKHLHAHHVLHAAVRPDLRYAMGNGVTLCAACHYVVHHPKRQSL